MITASKFLLISASALSAVASIFCAVFASHALTVCDPRLAICSWIGMMWFAMLGLWFVNRATRKDR